MFRLRMCVENIIISALLEEFSFYVKISWWTSLYILTFSRNTFFSYEKFVEVDEMF